MDSYSRPVEIISGVVFTIDLVCELLLRIYFSEEVGDKY